MKIVNKIWPFSRFYQDDNIIYKLSKTVTQSIAERDDARARCIELEERVRELKKPVRPLKFVSLCQGLITLKSDNDDLVQVTCPKTAWIIPDGTPTPEIYREALSLLGEIVCKYMPPSHHDDWFYKAQKVISDAEKARSPEVKHD